MAWPKIALLRRLPQYGRCDGIFTAAGLCLAAQRITRSGKEPETRRRAAGPMLRSWLLLSAAVLVSCNGCMQARLSTRCGKSHPTTSGATRGRQWLQPRRLPHRPKRTLRCDSHPASQTWMQKLQRRRGPSQRGTMCDKPFKLPRKSSERGCRRRGCPEPAWEAAITSGGDEGNPGPERIVAVAGRWSGRS